MPAQARQMQDGSIDGVVRNVGEARRRCTRTDVTDFLRKVFPPQVTAVMLAIVIGAAPPWAKGLFIPAQGADPNDAPLAFVYGAARALGGGFIPLQMIAL